VRPCCGARNRAMRQHQRVRFGQANDAEAGPAQRGIETQNYAMGIGRCAQCCFKNGRGHARGNAAEALPHLFKLPTRDAHMRILPAAERLQKQKRRDDLSARRSLNHQAIFNVPAHFGFDPVC